MKYLWEVTVQKDTSNIDSYTFNVIAETMADAIRRSENEAASCSGYKRSFKATKAERSEIKVI